MKTKFAYGDAEDITRQYKRLRRTAHPDGGGSDDAFRELRVSYENALRTVKEGLAWDDGTSIIYTDDVKGSTKVPYLVRDESGIETSYAGPNAVVFTVDPANSDLLFNARKTITACFANPGPSGVHGLREKTLYALPGVVGWSPTTLVVAKPPLIHPLRRVLSAYAPIDLRHVAWMIGRLLHIACYLEWHGTVHGSVSIDHLYVNLEAHTLHLYGGWWYSGRAGTPAIALPIRSADLAPVDTSGRRMLTHELDLEVIRYTIANLFDAESSTRLMGRKEIPRRVREFLAVPFSGRPAVTVYREWEQARDAGFGARKFIPFDYTESTIYGARET